MAELPGEHGTRSHYTQGCRHPDCVEANRLYHSEYREQKRREADTPKTRLLADDDWYERMYLRVHGSPSPLSHDAILGMRQRARRVLTNGTTSGSARALARDVLLLTEGMDERAVHAWMEALDGRDA